MMFLTWVPFPDVGSSVSGAYHILTKRVPSHDLVSSDLLWRGFPFEGVGVCLTTFSK